MDSLWHTIVVVGVSENRVNHENVITTTSRFTIVNALYQMIVDLGRFKSNNFALDSMLTPFEFFYQSYIRKIYFEINKVITPDLDGFVSELIARELRGRGYRTV